MSSLSRREISILSLREWMTWSPLLLMTTACLAPYQVQPDTNSNSLQDFFFFFSLGCDALFSPGARFYPVSNPRERFIKEHEL